MIAVNGTVPEDVVLADGRRPQLQSAVAQLAQFFVDEADREDAQSDDDPQQQSPVAGGTRQARFQQLDEGQRIFNLDT